MAQVEIACDASDQTAECVEDEVAHRVAEAGLLHVHPKARVHREFKNFPCGADGHGDAKADERDGGGGRGEAVAFEQHEGEQEPHEAKSHRRRAMEREVPPPQTFVEIERLAQEDGGKAKQRGEQQKGQGECQGPAGCEQGGDQCEAEGGEADEGEGPAR